jgi:glycosyltransferase involved in cell wall biosynthesis
MIAAVSTNDAPLSILHLLAPGQVGGLEQVVRALAAGQRERGFAVCVGVARVVPGRPHPFVDALASVGVIVEQSCVARHAYGREQEWVRALCRRRRPDVVHTHGLRADTVHGPVARALGIATVSTVHGITSAGWKSWLYHQLEWRSLRRADAVVAVSRQLVDVLAKLGIRPERIAEIRNGYAAPSTVLSRAEARERLGIDSDGFTIGWVGRLRHEKGADVLIDAVGALRDLPVSVSIVGAGEDEQRLRRRARERGVADRMRWHGTVAEAGTLMRAFDVFALSSRSEGTPIALLEAVAAGVPVVASSVGGVPDVVSNFHARLVPPQDPAALAWALRNVYDDRAAAAARAGAAAQRLSQAFGPQPWLAQYETLYREVLARRSRPQTER